MAHEKKRSHYAVRTSNSQVQKSDIDTDNRTVKGVLNTYNMVDFVGDILMMGCAAKSIKERGVNSKAIVKIKFCKNHDLCQMPAKLTVLDEREVDGNQVLYFEAKMGNSQLGNDTLMEYIDGIIDNHSIGFNYVWEKVKAIKINTPEWDDMLTWIINPKDLAGRSEVYLVKEIKLWEGSCVAFGANSMTPFLGMAKSRNKESIALMLDTKIQKLEKGIDEAIRNVINAKSVGENTDELKTDVMSTFNAQLNQLRQLVEDVKEFIVVPDEREKLIIEEKGIDYDAIINNLQPKPIDLDKLAGLL